MRRSRHLSRGPVDGVRLRLAVVLCLLLGGASAAWGAGIQVTLPQGPNGQVIAYPGDQVQIYSVQLRDSDNAIISQSYLGRPAPANTGIQVILNDLSVGTGFTMSDVASLQLYRSTDGTFDGADVLLATETALGPLGGATELNVTGAALGQRQLPNPGSIYFIVTATIAASARAGHAFTVAALNPHIGIDESLGLDNDIGSALVANDGNNISISGQPQPTRGGLAIPFGGEPVMLCLLLATGAVVLWRRSA